MKIRIYIILIIVNFSILKLNCQTDKSPEDSLPIDKSVRYGILDNGLTYYIKPLKSANSGLKLRFYVKVGSEQEEAKEIDFAHALEHLAFRETENFPKGLNNTPEILVPLGMDESDIMGNTNNIWTEYFFNIPDNNFSAINVGLKWFKDIADGLVLSKENIDRERGVLMQEYRRDDANRKKLLSEKSLYFQLFPCQRNNEQFKERNKNFSHLELKKFYKKWYRSDLMGVSVVGDIENVESLEKQVKLILSDIKKPLDKPSQSSCDDTYYSSSPNFVVVNFQQDTISTVLGTPVQVNLFFRDPESQKYLESWRGIKLKVKSDLFARILNKRFDAESHNYIKKHNIYSIHTQNLDKSPGALRVTIRAQRGKDEESVESAINILNQVRKYGVLPEELNWAKKEFLANWRLSLTKSENYWISQIRQNFVRGEALPSGKVISLRNFIQELSIEDLNRTATRILSKVPEDIGVIAPKDYTGLFIKEKETRKFIRDNFKNAVIPFEIPNLPKKLLSKTQFDSLPLKGYQKTPSSISGGQIFTLENGIKLFLKPGSSPVKSGNVYLHGFSKDGASSFSEEDYYSAVYSPLLIKHSGIGDMNKFQLKRYLKTTKSLNIDINPYIGFNEAGIKGMVSNDDLEVLMQLIYLYITEPRKDSMAFKDWKISQFKFLEKSKNAINDFIDKQAALTKDYRNLPFGTKRISAIASVDNKKAFEIYNQIFSQAGDFQFIITGDFKSKQVLQLARKYLGNLPNVKNFQQSSGVSTIQSDLPKGPIYQRENLPDLYSSENAYYGFKYIHSETKHTNWREQLKVQALGVVTNRIIKDLRSKDGFSLYSFGVAGNHNRVMNRFEVNFRFSCEPDELSLLKERIYQIIDDIKDAKISPVIFKEGMEKLYGKYETKSQEHPLKIQKRLYRKFRYGEPVIAPEMVKRFLNSITIKDIASIAKKYYRSGNKYELLMIDNMDLKEF